jgi:hypothetical protein
MKRIQDRIKTKLKDLFAFLTGYYFLEGMKVLSILIAVGSFHLMGFFVLVTNKIFAHFLLWSFLISLCFAIVFSVLLFILHQEEKIKTFVIFCKKVLFVSLLAVSLCCLILAALSYLDPSVYGFGWVGWVGLGITSVVWFVFDVFGWLDWKTK